MGINIKTAPPRLVEALRKRRHSDDEIAKMSGKEAFSEYCQWHGLIGYGHELWTLVEACQKQDRRKVAIKA